LKKQKKRAWLALRLGKTQTTECKGGRDTARRHFETSAFGKKEGRALQKKIPEKTTGSRKEKTSSSSKVNQGGGSDGGGKT